MAPSPLQGRVFDRYQQFKTLSTTLQQQTQAAADALVQHKVFGVQPSSIFSFSSVYGVRSDTVVATILKTVSNREEAERIVDGLVLSGVLALQNEDATAATTLEGFAAGKNTIFVPTDNEVAGRKNQLSVWSLRQGAIQAGAIKRPGGLFSKPRDAYAIAHETRKALYLFDSDASLQVKDSMELQNAFVEFEKSWENGIKVSNPTSSIVFGVPTGMQDEWLNSIINAGATYREAYSGNVDQVKSIYELKDRDMAGHDVSMEQYKGKVILAVNVSSLCGLTPTNYPELAALDVKYRDQGLQILAFPCNQFAHQEPGTHEEIVEFVKQYHCEFPFFEKQDVNGANARPVFTYLKAKLPGSFGNFVKWNFTKFLVDRNGQPFKRYAPKDLPFSFEEDIKTLLAQASTSQ